MSSFTRKRWCWGLGLSFILWVLAVGQASADPDLKFEGPQQQTVTAMGKSWTLPVYRVAGQPELMAPAEHPALKSLARSLGRDLEWSSEAKSLKSDLGRILTIGRIEGVPSPEDDSHRVVPPSEIDGKPHIPLSALGPLLEAKATLPMSGRKDVAVEPVLKSISFIETSDRGATLRLETSVPVRKKVFTLSSPYRLVIDLMGVALEDPKSPPQLDHPVLGEVRVGQFQLAPSITRVVLEYPNAGRHQTVRSLDLFEHKVSLTWPAQLAANPSIQTKTRPTIGPVATDPPSRPAQNPTVGSNPSERPPVIRPVAPETTPQIGPPRTERPATQPASPVPTPSKRPTLTGVSWQSGKLKLELSEPIAYSWSRLAGGQHRYVLDLQGVVFPEKRQQLSGAVSGVQAVRVVQNMPEPNPVVRVVVDMQSPMAVLPDAPDEKTLVLEFPGRQIAAGEIQKGSSRTKKLPPGSVQGRTICIDPGHGGSDPGAINRSVNLTEKQATLDISLRLQKILEARGWNVVMTRTVDRDVSWAGSSASQELGARARVANQAGADVFLSIHCDAAANSAAQGTSLHWYKAADLRLAQALESDVLRATGRNNRGLLKNRFYVLAHTTMPAVLVETAFLTNPTEGALLADPNYRQKIAEGIARGLDTYAALHFGNRLSQAAP